MRIRIDLEVIWLGWPFWWRYWRIIRPSWESSLRWNAHLGPVMVRSYR